MTNKELHLKLDKARWFVLREQPFYGQLAMGLIDTLDDAIPTACTDGKRVRWGKKFLAALTDEETRFVVLHECLHCAHGHLWRLPHDQKANIACDYKVNQILAPLPGMQMPKCGLTCPPEFSELAEEEIYHRLPDDHGQGTGAGSPSACGDFEAPAEDQQPGNKPGEQGEGQGSGTPSPITLKEEWERRVIQAEQYARALGKGDLPADLQRILERVRENKLDWRQEMADFVRDVVSHRNDWTRSARRHAWQKVIYPRRKQNDIGLVIFARDTSGSIDNADMAEFSAHISTALAEAGCRGLVLDCDSEIHAEHPLSPGDECPLTAQGGGGTSHLPIWTRAAELVEQGESIAGIVTLTDCATDWPEASEWPSLCLSTTDAACPFGRTIKIR